MSAFLRDLRGLNVLTVNPEDSEGQFLVTHLRRIGCRVNSVWPIPDTLPPSVDVVFLSIHDEALPAVRKLLQSVKDAGPTMIAIVNYENPAILQIVLESRFFAVIERPLRAFGLLANLAIARTLWKQYQQTLKDSHRYKRRALGDQTVARAKVILMASGLDESQAHNEIRTRAQAARMPIEAFAESIVSGNAMSSEKAGAMR